MGCRSRRLVGDESMTVDTVEQAIDVLQAQVQTRDVVLVKASRAVGLERVAQALLAVRP